ncbi:cytidine deaminase [Sphingomonas panacisoli]|uniref:Cytidine deaminase n=1 Tax=Sphingomonas panacisoli TaxID=1813879 RepID=A0A5B8LIW9_9SPHN|nr:cytidine deaminase [Sphingomonas panacisoli]QDZ07799.1 cytidine deaminase [Sphingomonas panacisoli]
MSEGEQLIAAAREAAANAYAPYSGFSVGAALLMSDGTIMGGANFENASYGLSLCAETVATATASAAGRLADIVAVGIVGGMTGKDGIEPILPCGRCRQVLNEAAQRGKRDLAVYCSGLTGGPTEQYRLSDLLPYAFGPANLGLA